MVQRLDANHGESPVVFHRRLGVHHVPVLGDRRIVELQDQPRVDDRPVFLAHRIGAGVQQFLVGLVVRVGDPRGAARGDRTHEALLDARRLHRRLEVGDVGRDRVVAGIGDRPDADRRRRSRPGGDAGLGIGVGRGEPAAIPAVAEAGQHDLAGAGPARRRIERAGAGRKIESAEAAPGVAPPRAVLHALGHRLAELAVTGDVDAEIALTADDLRHRRPQRLLERRLIDRFAGLVGAVRRDQPVRARQAADMAGRDMVGAGFHGFPPSHPVR